MYRAPRPGRFRLLRRPARASWSPPPEHHRSGSRPAADVRMHPGRYGSATTVRFSIMRHCARNCRNSAASTEPKAIPKPFCMPTGNTGSAASNIFAGCSVSRYGIRMPRFCFAPGTGWESSRSTTSGTDGCSPSARRSRLCWRIPPSRLRLRNAHFRNTWLRDI